MYIYLNIYQLVSQYLAVNFKTGCCLIRFILANNCSPQIGLDFTPWYAQTTQERDEQIEVFKKQLEISKELHLPV